MRCTVSSSTGGWLTSRATRVPTPRDAPKSAAAAPANIALDELRLDFKVTALAKSDAMRLSYDGIQDCAGADCMSAQNDNVEPTDLEELTRFLNEDYNGNRVVVDCTGSRH